jgi:hypothetical protein
MKVIPQNSDENTLLEQPFSVRAISARALQTLLGKLKAGFTLKQARGGCMLVVGYLLSPLCWWNDLFFNLPVAYGFGVICSWVSADLLIPGSIAGYWLSNIAGILLMQAGAVDVMQKQAKERDRKKEILSGLFTSTAFTVVVLVLIQLNILDTPNLLNGG